MEFEEFRKFESLEGLEGLEELTSVVLGSSEPGNWITGKLIN